MKITALHVLAFDHAAQGDFPARRMIDSVAGVDPARRARLLQVLDIDPEWRMHRVSDGQRRRVQICLGLLHPFQAGTSLGRMIALCSHAVGLRAPCVNFNAS